MTNFLVNLDGNGAVVFTPGDLVVPVIAAVVVGVVASAVIVIVVTGSKRVRELAKELTRDGWPGD